MPFANRADFLAAIARDLGDPDGNTWTSDDLSRALDHALDDLADAAGVATSVDVPASGSDTYDLSEYPEIRQLAAVEWPVDEQPPAYLRFHVWGATLRLLDAAPPTGETLRLHYRRAFAVDDESSDVPDELAELAVLGARAYAMLQQAARTAATVNVDGWVSRRYELQGERLLARFREALSELRQARDAPPFPPGQTPAWYDEND
ncbi:MAG: hypothetical protein Kow00123_17720 [Anaerolineales bacterium]